MKDLTPEMIDDACRCKQNCCSECKMMIDDVDICCEVLASALKAEKAKAKGDVWKDAPEDAVEAMVSFYRKIKVNTIFDSESIGKYKKFFRELPKSRARMKAEATYGRLVGDKDLDTHIIEAAIKEAMEAELKEGER